MPGGSGDFARPKFGGVATRAKLFVHFWERPTLTDAMFLSQLDPMENGIGQLHWRDSTWKTCREDVPNIQPQKWFLPKKSSDFEAFRCGAKIHGYHHTGVWAAKHRVLLKLSMLSVLCQTVCRQTKDPVIFSGTVHYNLDPFNEFDAATLNCLALITVIKIEINWLSLLKSLWLWKLSYCTYELELHILLFWLGKWQAIAW